MMVMVTRTTERIAARLCDVRIASPLAVLLGRMYTCACASTSALVSLSVRASTRSAACASALVLSPSRPH